MKNKKSMFHKVINGKYSRNVMGMGNTKTYVLDWPHAIGTEDFKVSNPSYRPRNRTYMWHEGHTRIAQRPTAP
jgi:hypothetical protein